MESRRLGVVPDLRLPPSFMDFHMLLQILWRSEAAKRCQKFQIPQARSRFILKPELCSQIQIKNFFLQPRDRLIQCSTSTQFRPFLIFTHSCTDTHCSSCSSSFKQLRRRLSRLQHASITPCFPAMMWSTPCFLPALWLLNLLVSVFELRDSLAINA